MVYTDKAGHLIADSVTELHLFAETLGLRREWFQEHDKHPHYDLTTPRMRAKAVVCGAVLVSSREILRLSKLQTSTT